MLPGDEAIDDAAGRAPVRERPAGGAAPSEPEPGRDSHNRPRWFLPAFALLVVVSGLVMLVAVPPGAAPDENQHFLRAYAISDGKLIPVITPSGHGGAVLPRCLQGYLVQRELTTPRLHHIDIPRAWRTKIRCGGSKPRFADHGNTAVNSPVTYVPQATAIAAVRLATTSAKPSWLMFAGRIGGLVAYLLLVAGALLLAPRAWPLLFTVAVLPSSVALAAALSSDTMVLGLAILAAALYLRLRWTPARRDWRWRAAFGACLVVLALCKNAYAPFLLLWFLVPRDDRQRDARAWVELVSVPAVGFLLAGAWATRVSKISFFPPSAFTPGIDPTRQLTYVLHHPGHFAGSLFRTIFSSGELHNTFFYVIDRYPSSRGVTGATLPVPVWMVVVGVIALLLALWLDAGPARRKVSWPAIGTIAFVFVSTFVLIYLLVYMVASPVGGDYILVVQGRYFVPLIPLLALVVAELREPARRLSSRPGAARERTPGSFALAMRRFAPAGIVVGVVVLLAATVYRVFHLYYS